jgi:hypothetical protein
MERCRQFWKILIGWSERFFEKNAGIAPLQLPTLAVFQPWGIKEELVVPAVRN